MSTFVREGERDRGVEFRGSQSNSEDILDFKVAKNTQKSPELPIYKTL